MARRRSSVSGFDVGGGGEEAEHGEAESAENEDEKRDDYTESELAHEASGSIVADGAGGALIRVFAHLDLSAREILRSA